MVRAEQPWLHDLDITVDGPVTVLAEPSGDLGAIGTGVIADDRRVVATLQLLLGGAPCVPVASSAVGARSEHWSAARHLGDVGPDPTVEVHRRRTISELTITDTITVRSRAAAAVSTVLTLLAATDGAHISAIKSGSATGTALDATTSPLGWADTHHRTVIECAPEPAVAAHEPAGGLRMEWPVMIEPASQVDVTVTWTIHRRDDIGFGAGSRCVDWDADELAASAPDPRLAQLVRVGLTDLQHLTLRDPIVDRIVAAAGTPWFLTLFGRDALWTARFMVGQSQALAAGTLHSLAYRQAQTTDVETAAEPGKMLHELRHSAPGPTRDALPPLYYGTVDATPLWIILLHEAWTAGLPVDDITPLLPALDAALEWMRDAAARSSDGLLRYRDASGHGLANQGWKDSADSMRRRDGSIAPAPIALLEAQAYAVHAALAAVDIGTALGRDTASWGRWAADLAERVRAMYWMDADGDPYLAMAIDGNGEPVDGVGSNMGHALATGLLDQAESEKVVARLMRPDMLRPFGIGTLSTDNPAYNPIGYHTGSVWAHDTAIIARGMARAGFADEASIVAERLVRLGAATGGRLPELCGGEPIGDRPVPYPASCRPQAWAAAAAAVALDLA